MRDDARDIFERIGVECVITYQPGSGLHHLASHLHRLADFAFTEHFDMA